MFGAGTATASSDLMEWSHPLSHDHVMEISAKPLAYHVFCDGALRHDDRILTGVQHMFGGTSILAISVRQHIHARDAHASECFNACTAAAQCIPLRGVLTELGVKQAYPTPIGVD